MPTTTTNLTKENRDAIIVGVAIAAGGAALSGLVAWGIEEAKAWSKGQSAQVLSAATAAVGLGFATWALGTSARAK